MHSGNGAENPLNPGLVFEMVNAQQRTAALKAAIDIDLFRAVGEGPGDVASIARHCSASERGIRILCDFLTINGVLVKKEDGSYRHTPTSAAFLDPRSESCMASVAQFLSNPALRGPYEHLAEVVRAGRTNLPGDGTVEPENPVWVQFAEQMAPMMGPMAGPLGKVVLHGQSGPMRVLDIAAGHGLFGIEIAKQNPQAHVTGLDWAPVLRVALDNARKALRPGGQCATLEFVPNEDRVSPPTPAAFAMTMLTTTAAGDAYTLSELTSMYHEAGFKGIGGHPIPMSPHTIVTGHA